MNVEKMGALIRRLRTEKQMTQLELADQLHISDKTVSKWERGQGCPDIAILPKLAQALQIQVETLLEGRMELNAPDGGNMKRMKFHVCPYCGNLLTATGDATVSCCGKTLDPMQMEKAQEGEKLNVECIEDEYFVSSAHEMTREHYISFVALLKGDTLLLRKMYPEWNLETRLPQMRRAMLIWHCTKHGLKYQLL